VDDNTIQAILRHSNIGLTQNAYIKSVAESQVAQWMYSLKNSKIAMTLQRAQKARSTENTQRLSWQW
jgi:hypothetical protein